ncbi:MAG: hypothetical protein IPJ85_16315 [Flavobacteriales bacterium]|nr:hypothetical protein [Flavobacteriales bacterium]
MLIEFSPGNWISNGYQAGFGMNCQYMVQAGTITLLNVAGQSFNILSKPAKLLITYEE